MIKNIVKKLNVILLVGGKGTRMNEIDDNKNYFPKALQLINNKPLILHVMNNFIEYDLHNIILYESLT